MSANEATEETTLVTAAAAWLAEHLPPAWSVDSGEKTVAGFGDSEPQRVDATIDVRAPNGTYTTFAVEAKRSFEPRDVEQLLRGLTRLLRTLAGNVPVLVVAPWLSARTRELLERERINYLDLTGNAFIRLDNPAIYIKAAGATRNPDPEPRRRASLRGPKAARLIRLLADVRPPYGVRELARTARLTPGYVSRLLDTLDRDALVDRSRRGEVESVDLPGLLRRWTDFYDVLKTNKGHRFVAQAGASDAIGRLADKPAAGRTAVTGSFAAVRRAPVAAPALLLVYTSGVEARPRSTSCRRTRGRMSSSCSRSTASFGTGSHGRTEPRTSRSRR
jgi:hypothetical protein